MELLTCALCFGFFQQQKLPVLDSDDDEELLELKERLAAYNIESPDQTGEISTN